MKNKFLKTWNSSVQPRKQRKFLANAPTHIRRKIMRCNLSPALRKKMEKRNVVVRKGDTVLIMRGQFKKQIEKIERVDRKKYKLYLNNVTIEKKDGTKIKYPIHYSNVQITELDLTDKKRFKKKKVSE